MWSCVVVKLWSCVFVEPWGCVDMIVYLLICAVMHKYGCAGVQCAVVQMCWLGNSSMLCSRPPSPKGTLVDRTKPYGRHCALCTKLLYIVLCTLCTVVCTLYTVICTLYTVLCTLYTVQYSLCTMAVYVHYLIPHPAPLPYQGIYLAAHSLPGSVLPSTSLPPSTL